MTDHKAEAEQSLHTLIHDYNEMHAKLTRMVAAGEGVGADELVATFLPMVALAGSAQAHATLAVAEQQRIANLIALCRMRVDRSSDAYVPKNALIRVALGQAIEGLGI